VEDLVVKDTWPLMEQNNEQQMYAAAQGLFGVPKLLASYEVRGPNELNTTTRFLPADSKPWDVWQAQSADPTPEYVSTLAICIKPLEGICYQRHPLESCWRAYSIL